ncbi:sialic acid-binding Ig-like lectin 12 [Anolis carolinensis]|uniref:sialic acid-binding Ig-like lectin 12 n=1 Tax=Anolis carolinensis TaxID=28377 RepID=UPI002F2B769A
MAELYGYWYEEGSNIAFDPPVATNDDRKTIAQYARKRFYLLEGLKKGVCSFIISNVQDVDQKTYFFRMEKGRIRINYHDFQTTVTVTGTYLCNNLLCCFTHLQAGLIKLYSLWFVMLSICNRIHSAEDEKSNSSWISGGKMTLILVESSWKMKNQICFIAVWIFLSKGVLSQHAGYTLTASAFVSVQRGLDVHILCQFTYNKQHVNNFSTFYGYWFKSKEEPFQCASVPSQSKPDLLMTTNKEGQTIKESTKNRIHLDGDLEQGNCSFWINDAQLEDEGSYYFRVEQGNILKYSFYHKTLQVFMTGKHLLY